MNREQRRREKHLRKNGSAQRATGTQQPPTPSGERPSPQPLQNFFQRVQARPLALAATCVRASLRFFWRRVLVEFGGFFWRRVLVEFGGLLSVAYLAFSSIYDIAPQINAIQPDPTDPLFYPFPITNTSHLFDLVRVQAACSIDYGKFSNGTIMYNLGTRYLGVAQIPAGGVINLPCLSIPVAGGHLDLLRISVNVQYTIQFAVLGINFYDWSRRTSEIFSYDGKPQTPLWVKGKVFSAYGKFFGTLPENMRQPTPSE